MRRSLFVINSIDDQSGGTLRAVVNVAEAMQLAGAEVTIVAPRLPGAEYRTVENAAGLDVRLFPAWRRSARIGWSARQALWLLRHARSYDDVHVHSIFHVGAGFAALLAAAVRRPLVVWPHGSLDPFDLHKHATVKRVLGPTLVRPILAGSSAVLLTSTREADELVTYGARVRREVVALPVAAPPPGEGAAFRARYGLAPDRPLVLFLGRVNYKKGLPLLIDAVSRLSHDAVLVVAGSGEDDAHAAAVSAAAQHGLTDRTVFTGWIEGADRADALAAADVFALLSDNENFGLAVVEALAAGVPAVISDQVYLAEDIAASGAGLVVERDAAAAAKAIDSLLTDPVRAADMGRAAATFAASEYGPLRVGERLVALQLRRGRPRKVR